jgi:predicted nucleic acid-binding protein
MIVVADASPLNYLIQIESETLLQKLFGRVLVPGAVMEELRHAAAPTAVASWVACVPSWIEIRTVAGQRDQTLEILDPGEREAILLAQETRADLLLIDEKQGRAEARRRGISTTGTLGVLLAGGARNLVDAEAALLKLISATSFRAAPEIREDFLARCREFRRGRK